MSSRDLVIGIVFLSQTIVGVLGNFSLLYHYVFLYFIGCKLRNTDLILKHLIVANSLVLFSRGVPLMMATLGWKQFPSDFGCKLLFYVHRVGRGVSIGSTCLLSIFQAITISPRNSRWAELKAKAPKYISLSMSLCWLLFMLVNIPIPMYVTSKWRNDTIKKIKNFGYCFAVSNNITVSLFAAWLSFPDALCLGLMLCASSSMLSILYRHKQRVRHIHRTNLSPRSSPEFRATKIILLLVSTFVSFYALSSICQVYITLLKNPSWLLMKLAPVFTVCFPTISPFVLMRRDSSVSRHLTTWVRKMKSLNLLISI
ncbi:vomeronasal type-1 receptor 4-like [Tamandua tetradactyla]|uniref:vomeronasal type-1 receptor 4-like n=1 Tax=Tamandua tetradactyla TaxID=48850 RepID=UPI00405381E2